MHFRKATIADVEEMKELFCQTIEFVCNKDYTAQQIEAWIATSNNSNRWQEIIQLQRVLLALINTKIIGFGTLKNGNYIDLFYIHKDFQKQGIATAILSKLEDEAKKMLSKTITADVSITAKSFFEKQGFTILNKQQNIRNNSILVNYKMQKEL